MDAAVAANPSHFRFRLFRRKEAMKKIPTSYKVLALAGLAGVGIYAYSKQKYKASSASMGDTVLVPVAALPAGSLPAAIPQGVGYVAVVVTKKPFFGDTLDGYLAGYVLQLNPLLQVPFPNSGMNQYPVQLHASQVTSVYHNAQLVA